MIFILSKRVRKVSYFKKGKFLNYLNKSYKQQHYPVVEIHARGLIPTAINWHKATNFRQIEKVYKYHRPIYDSWIKKGLIPDYAIEKVKQYQERLREV